MSQATRECQGCHRPVNAAVPVCPFCGHRAGGAVAPSAPGVVARSPGGGTPRQPPATGGAPGATPRPPPLPARPPPLEPAGPSCPRCGAPPGPRPLRVETWKEVAYWHPGRRKFLVLSKDLPGLCGECAAWVRGRRWLAAAAMVAPFLFGAFAGGLSGTASAVVAGLYGLYLVRTGSYGLADAVLFGAELEEGAGDLIPRFPDGSAGRVRFPGGLLQAAARLGVAAVLGGLLAFVGVTLREAGDRGSAQDTLSLLSRPSTVFVPLGGEGTRLARSDVGGTRAAVVAHTAWASVPPGAAMQLSPHDAMERALEDPEVEAVVFDPGPGQIVVPRADFASLKLHLPLWPTPARRVEKR